MKLTAYVGFDSREIPAYIKATKTLYKNASTPVQVVTLAQSWLRARRLYYRQWEWRKGQRIDLQDGKPFSTEFAFTRFLVPALNDYAGWALFCDCDFLFRADIADLLPLLDEQYAVRVVKHDYRPAPGMKMDACKQEPYPRKNWSSFILWNCGHPANKALTVEGVNSKPGSFLHGFGWLPDSAIGDLPEAWNWLEGHSPEDIEPKAVHFTRGGPWFENYVPARTIDERYADEWAKA